jgi:hypothetical protein
MPAAASTPYERFKQIIRAWHASPHRDRALALNQVANMAWRMGDPTHAGYVSRVVQHPMFRDFFVTDWISAGKIGHTRVDWSAVREAYPSLLGEKLAGGAYEIMDRALQDEAAAVKKRPRGPGVHVRNAVRLNKAAGRDEDALVEYDYQTDDPEDDAPFPFSEGLPVKVKLRDGRPFHGTLQAVDEDAQKLIVRFKGQGFSLGGILRERKEALVHVKREALQRMRQRPGVHRRLLERQPLRPKTVSALAVDANAILDPSQRKAVDAAGAQDVTVIWGPPGTGKTHAVGELVAHLAREGKRVLVAAIANVAVDQAALAAIRAVDHHGWGDLLSEGRFLRHGYARDPAVTAEGRLFPQKEEARALRKQIEHYRKKLKEPDLDRRSRARARMRVDDAQQELAGVTRRAIDRARVVFTTVHQTALSTAFPTAPGFDVVVLDEASMMSTVDALLAASHAKAQIVIAGDVRQLGPVAVASTEAARKCLHRDILTHLHVDRTPEPPLVRMLLRQRRMHPDVSALVNRRFYDGRLTDHAALDRLRAASMDPAPDQGTVVVSTEGVEDARAEHTTSQSRRNRGSARIAASLAAWFAQTVRVGLITPYNGQVALLKRHLKSIEDAELRSRIQVGTIHTFQGSERDVIIWDQVETADLELGRLFRDDAGKRLVNVAVSRAQGKLVVVGAPSAFSPHRSGSAKCLPLSQMLFANTELGGRKQPWSKVKARLGVLELPLAAHPKERRGAQAARDEPATGRPRRRLVRPRR